MKITFAIHLIVALAALSAPHYAQSGPVLEKAIPEAVDWFVHVDVEQLLQTQTGSAAYTEMRGLIPSQEEAGLPLDPILIAEGIRGITVFGTMPDFTAEAFEPDAVVLLEGTDDLIQVFKGLVSGMQIEQPEAIVPVENDANGILSLMDGQMYGSFVDENRIAISKALPGLETFFDVYQGEGAPANLGERFAVNSGDASTGIFFGAFVEGLDEFEELPVQARILKLTEAVSVQVGEQGELVNLLASLMTSNETTASQVSEVLKGIIAVATLTHNGNPEIATLINTAKVELDQRTVTLNVSYPVEAAVAFIVARAQEMRAEREAAAAAQEAEVEESSPAEAEEEPESIG